MMRPVHLCKPLIIILLCIVCWGCGAGQPVRVLPAGTTTLTASAGGPIAPDKVPSVIIPYLTAGVMHGVTDDVTIHGNAHLLMAAFGVGGIDAGASIRTWHQRGSLPELTVGARLMMFSDFRSFDNMRFYPDLAATFSYDTGSGWLAYFGLHQTLQTTTVKYFASPFAGLQIPLSASFSIQAEFIWQAVNHVTRNGILEGQSSIGGRGSAGGFIGGAFRL